MFGTTFFMYDSGMKNNIETPRLDLGVVIYVSLTPLLGMSWWWSEGQRLEFVVILGNFMEINSILPLNLILDRPTASLMQM